MRLNTSQVIIDVQRHVKHGALKWMAATLDGRVESTGAVFEAKFMLPWSFSEEAAEKYMPQLQHNMWAVAAKSAVLSVITGGGKWVEINAHADPLYQHLIVTAERKFWRSSGPSALSVTSDFDARTAVERELVLRLAGLLWRLRRATAIENGLLQIQSDILREVRQAQGTRKQHHDRAFKATVRSVARPASSLPQRVAIIE